VYSDFVEDRLRSLVNAQSMHAVMSYVCFGSEVRTCNIKDRVPKFTIDKGSLEPFISMHLRADSVLIITAVMAAGASLYLALISTYLPDGQTKITVLIVASGLLIAAIILSIYSILFEAIFRKSMKTAGQPQ